MRRCDSISVRSAAVWRFDSSCATSRLLCVSTSHQATVPAISSSAAKAFTKPSFNAPATAGASGAPLAASVRSSWW